MTDAARTHAEHFQDLARQRHASELGMWVFLGSETLLFGALLGVYTGLRIEHAHAFAEAGSHNDITLGSTMTVLLIVSSFCVAWAVRALRRSAIWQCLVALGAAELLGFAFLALKVHEYTQHAHEGILPGAAYHFEALPGAGARMFFTLYYTLTALHGLHVIGGLVALAWLGLLVKRRALTPTWHHPLELGGLYWHMVDIVWIFLWPLLYLNP